MSSFFFTKPRYTFPYMHDNWILPKRLEISNRNHDTKAWQDHTQPINYRPISLLNCLGKLFERILANRLLNHCHDTNLFNPWQRAYLRHKEGSEHLYKLGEQTNKGISKQWTTGRRKSIRLSMAEWSQV